MKRDGAFAPLREAAYRRLWLAGVLFGMGQWLERTATGWIVLELTGSVFLTAVTWTVRALPNLLLGSISGAVADRYPRNRVLVFSAVVRALVVATMGLVVAVAGRDAYPSLLVLLAIGGASMTLNLGAMQPLAVEVAGPGRMASAVSVLSLGQRTVGALAALGSGFLLAAIGSGATLLLASIPIAISSLLFLGVRSAPRPAPTTRFAADVLAGLKLIVQVRMVSVLLALMVCAEILGFSFQSLMPAVAEQILKVGPEGFGVLSSGVQVGSVVGSALLAMLVVRVRLGPLLLGAVAAFGALLVGLAESQVFVISLLVVGGIGAMASSIDALQWMLLQANVDEGMRGRVLGAWNMAIGWGWVGPVVLGAMAESIGVSSALLLSGLLLLAIGAATAAGSRRLRAS